jgi:signal transduction histidine kinase
VSRNVVVKGHGGELHFTTEPGKGTTFFVRLPICGQK